MTSSNIRRTARATRTARPLLAFVIAVASATCGETSSLSPLKISAPESQLMAAGLTINPGNDTALVGQTIKLTVSGIPGGKQVVWVSSDTNVAKVVSTGSATAGVTGRAPGVVTIVVSTRSKNGAASVRVMPVPVRSVIVVPATATVQLGDSAWFAPATRTC